MAILVPRHLERHVGPQQVKSEPPEKPVDEPVDGREDGGHRIPVNTGSDATPPEGEVAPELSFEGDERPCDTTAELILAVEALQQELAERDRKLREYIEAHEHSVNEMDAARKRMERDREGELDRFRAQLAEIMLGVVDDLERTLASGVSTGNVAAVLEGIGLVRNQVVARLAELGAEPMTTVGQTFDPNLHEAVGMIPVTEPDQDQIIVGEELTGYTYKGKLLRAARVIVGTSVDG